jgi:hypothetical protein
MSGRRRAMAQDERCGQSPEAPAAHLPRQHARERMPVIEHRQVHLGRDRRANRRGGATADERHPSGVDTKAVRCGIAGGRKRLIRHGRQATVRALQPDPQSALQPAGFCWRRTVGVVW